MFYEIGMDFQGGLRLGLGLRIIFTFCALSAQSPNDQRVLTQDGHLLIRFHRFCPLIMMEVSGSMPSNPRLGQTSSLNPYEITAASFCYF